MGLGLGPWEIVLILVVLLLVFGARRLPELGSSLGKGIREFKGSLRSIETDLNTDDTPPPAPRQQVHAPRAQPNAPPSGRPEPEQAARESAPDAASEQPAPPAPGSPSETRKPQS